MRGCDRKTDALRRVCELLDRDSEAARQILRSQCVSELGVEVPRSEARQVGSLPPGRTERRYSATQKTKLFIRDYFLDRYSGDQLVFPGVLRLLSHLFPSDFPYHPNWKYGVCHSWYWELYPTVDHVDATGADDEANWVTTSMMRNLKKSNTPLGHHGWEIRPIMRADNWDGLLSWYLKFLEPRAQLRRINVLNEWYRAGKTACTEAT